MNESPELSIQLDQFLKLTGVVASGGEAKHLVQSGAVLVNGEVEIRRGRKLKNGDIVQVHSGHWPVTLPCR